jgi:glyoxylase-like metal-dependent hydrolase (beta-lactamase superfamily II)
MARILAALVLAFVLLGATAIAHRVQACEMLKYQRVKPTKHVIVFQAAEGTTGVVNGNIAAVVGSEAILVVDTGQFPSIARRIVDEIRAASPLPVRHIVNTHWHGDHLLANGVFREAWPEARIVAHRHTIEQGAKFYEGYHEKAPARIRIALDDMRKRHDASTDEEERLFLSRTRDCGEKIEPEVSSTRYVAPDTPFDSEMRVDLGGVTAVVKHLGSGNTPGDLVVWVEGDRVAIVGDMLVYPAPYAIGSDLAPWSATLAGVQALEPRVIVPGHGNVMRNDHYLRDVRALLESTRAQLEALKAQGVSKAEAPGKLDTSAFASRYLTTPLRRQAFEQFFVKSAVHQVWR